MKKLFLTGICVLALVTLTSAAYAVSFPFPFPTGSYAGKYNNYEGFFLPGTTISTASNANELAFNTPLVAGDVNIGVFTVTTIYPYFGSPSDATFTSAGGTQGYITGVFIDTISTVTATDIASGPNSGDQLFLYFHTGGTDVLFNNVTIAQSIASAQQGTLMATFNFTPGVTLTPTSGGTLYDISGTAPSGSGTSSAAGYLSVIPGSGPWADLLNGNAIPNPTTLANSPPLPPPAGADLEEQSNFTHNTLSTIPWTFTSFDPFQGTTVIPEPGTLLLMGIGLTALAAFGRKRLGK